MSGKATAVADEPVIVPADLVRRVRDANAVWVATVGTNNSPLARFAAMNGRSAAVVELLDFVVGGASEASANLHAPRSGDRTTDDVVAYCRVVLLGTPDNSETMAEHRVAISVLRLLDAPFDAISYELRLRRSAARHG